MKMERAAKFHKNKPPVNYRKQSALRGWDRLPFHGMPSKSNKRAEQLENIQNTNCDDPTVRPCDPIIKIATPKLSCGQKCWLVCVQTREYYSEYAINCISGDLQDEISWMCLILLAAWVFGCSVRNTSQASDDTVGTHSLTHWVWDPRI